jgi:hypothetical protein
MYTTLQARCALNASFRYMAVGRDIRDSMVERWLQVGNGIKVGIEIRCACPSVVPIESLR